MLALIFGVAAVLIFIGRRDTKSIRLIGTSDTHGKFVAWDYGSNVKNTTGSMTQLFTAIKKYRNKNTLLLDAGDTFQSNSAELFMDEPVHPMIMAMNKINYDAWVTGNHDFDYAMSKVTEEMSTIDAEILAGNVYGPEGNHIADGYTIFKKNGLRIAVIGMTTPVCNLSDPENTEGYEVRDALAETRAIIDEIEGQYDILVGLFHMGLYNEYNQPNTGVIDICNACPEFDVMISSHEHSRVSGEIINGVLTVQNAEKAQTMAVIDLKVKKKNGKWEVESKKSELVEISEFKEDPEMYDMLKEYHEKAKADAAKVIGRIENLTEIEEVSKGKPVLIAEDSYVQDFVNEVQLYYSEADVSASQINTPNFEFPTNEIRKCDLAFIYKFSSNLSVIKMNGKQLRQFMEWSVGYIKQIEPGDTEISLDGDNAYYFYSIFSGVDYEIDPTKEKGSRIVKLTWPDGTDVKDDDEFTIALNNYITNNCVMNPDVIYDKGDLPELVNGSVHGEYDGIRDMIADYIENVKHGEITLNVDRNWKIILP